MDDRDLLRAYVEAHSQEAFAELVRRHVNLVYATALRVTCQSALAEDVAQTVFIRLAQLACTIRSGDALPGWLYRAACRTALTALRGESRRRARETAAAQMQEIAGGPDAAWERLAPLLDEAMSRLNEAEQNAVVLRFFEGRSLREVGEILRLSDDTAQKRLSRAIEKLRADLAAQGAAMPAAVFLPALSHHAVATAPGHLPEKILSVSAKVSTGGTAITLFHLVQIMSKTKIIATAAVVAVGVILYSWVWPKWSASPASSGTSPRAQPAPTASAPPPKPVGAVTPPPPRSGIEPPKSPPATNLPVVQASTPTLAANVIPPPTAQQVTAITSNLRQLWSAGQQFMLDKGLTQASYEDIVGTGPDAYLRPITQIAGEDYTGVVIRQSDTKLTIKTADGTEIEFNPAVRN